MRTLLAALTCLMLFNMPMVAMADSALQKFLELDLGDDSTSSGTTGDGNDLTDDGVENAIKRARTELCRRYIENEWEYLKDSIKLDDLRECFLFYKPLAEQGYADGQLGLGYMYDYGKGIPENDVQAAHWYRKAAEQGVVEAQYKIGSIYYKGEGVPRNFMEAYAWLSIATTQGNKDAKTEKMWIEELVFSGMPTEKLTAA